MLDTITDEELTFNPHTEYITNICKKSAINQHCFQIWDQKLQSRFFIYFIRSELEYGSVIWGHTTYTVKYCRLLVAAQKGALMLILRALKFTFTKALESELNIVPIELRLKEV